MTRITTSDSSEPGSPGNDDRRYDETNTDERAQRIQRLVDYYGSGECDANVAHRYVTVSQRGHDGDYLLYEAPTEGEALALLGDLMLTEDLAPEAVYDLDTGRRIEINVGVVIQRSEDQEMMENPLAEDALRQEEDEARAAAHVEAPKPFKRYTITLPNGDGFDCWIENMYEPESMMNRVLDIADLDAYSQVVDAPKDEEEAR